MQHKKHLSQPYHATRPRGRARPGHEMRPGGEGAAFFNLPDVTKVSL